MKRILIMGANPYNPNKGVAALAYSTLYILSEVLDKQNVEYEFCIYSHEFRSTFDNITYPDGKIVKFRNVYPTRIKSVFDFISLCFSKWKLVNLRDFLKSNYVLNIGAGDSFSDIYGEKHFNLINYPNILTRIFRKKLIFLPQTYGPFDTKGILWEKAISSLRYAEKIYSRDLQSTEFINQHIMLKHEVETFVDLAFYLPYRKVSIDDTSIHVGINVSGLLWNGGYTKNNQFGLKCDYHLLVLSIIKYFLAKENVFVHLVSHVLLPYSDVENDYECAKEIERYFNHSRIVVAPYFFDPIEAKSYISGLDFFLGSRMHACIGAFSSGVPVLLLSYSRKFGGLFSETLGYNCICNLKEIDESQVLNKIDEYFHDRSNLKMIIENINSLLEKKYDNFIKDFSKII